MQIDVFFSNLARRQNSALELDHKLRLVGNPAIVGFYAGGFLVTWSWFSWISMVTDIALDQIETAHSFTTDQSHHCKRKSVAIPTGHEFAINRQVINRVLCILNCLVRSRRTTVLPKIYERPPIVPMLHHLLVVLIGGEKLNCFDILHCSICSLWQDRWDTNQKSISFLCCTFHLMFSKYFIVISPGLVLSII